jgi:hypothetical protein
MGHTANQISVSNLFDENYINRRMTENIWRLSRIKGWYGYSTYPPVNQEGDGSNSVGYSAAEWQSGTAEHERAFDISLCMS